MLKKRLEPARISPWFPMSGTTYSQQKTVSNLGMGSPSTTPTGIKNRGYTVSYDPMCGYLRQSLEKTPFSHVITEYPVLHDVSHVVQYLLKKAEAERPETDQCFDVLTTIVSLCKKDRNVSLQQWYADTVEKVNDLNEVSSTFNSKELFVVPTCFIQTLFKVHAIREGHQELVKRVSRKNGGLCSTAKLQRELHLAAMADGGIRTAEEFSEQNEALLGSRGRRWERD